MPQSGSVKKLLFAFLLSIASASGLAQAWPARPIRMVIPLPPGGNTDVVARMIMQDLSARLGQPIVIDNKPGANGIIGTEIVAKAPPDGYTLGVVITAFATNPSMYRKLPYGPQELVPVSLLYHSTVVVATGHPAIRNLRDLAKYSSDGNSVSYATGGTGSLAHLLSERYVQAAGLKSVVHVPYKGGGLAVNDLASGRVTFMFNAMSAMGPQIRAGKLNALAVTSRERSPLLPDVPTAVEQGYPQLAGYSWAALIAPAGLPPAVMDKLSTELTAVLRSPELRQKLAAITAEPMPSTPAEAAAFIAQDAKVNGDLIRTLGLTAE